MLKESAAGRLPQEGDAALSLLYEVEEFAAEHGAELPASPATPLPTSTAGADNEIAALLAKGRLTPDEDQRLIALYEQRTAREDREEAATEAASGTKAPPDEYQRLIEKSVSSKLSPAEDGRLTQLAEQRAIDAGQAEPEDFTE